MKLIKNRHLFATSLLLICFNSPISKAQLCSDNDNINNSIIDTCPRHSSDRSTEDVRKTVDDISNLPALDNISPDNVSVSNPKLPDVTGLFVSDIKLNGNTILDNNTVSGLTGPYMKRTVTMHELHQLRYILSRHYFDRGYVNSGVLLPDQKVEQGIIHFQVIEGHLNKIATRGNRYLSDRYIDGRVRQYLSSTSLNVHELRQSLQLLQQNSQIQQIQAKLEPTGTPGDVVLNLDVKESPRYRVDVNFDNHSSPSLGEEHGGVNFSTNNLSGRGDQLITGVGSTEGNDEGFISYTIPINTKNASLGLTYSYQDSSIVEEDFQDADIDINGESESASLDFIFPVIRRVNRHFNIVAGIDRRQNSTTILGQPGFFLGTKNGESKTTSLRLGGEWMARNSRQVMALRAVYRSGINALDATINDSGIPDGKYQAVIGQLQYIYRVDSRYLGGQWRVNNTFQWTGEPLLSLEKFSMGGFRSVRGYRENQLVRDNGVYINIEYHLPLFQDRFGQSNYGLTAIPFIDYGSAWNEKISPIEGVTDLVDDKTEDIYSIGIGLTWKPVRWFSSSLFYGHALNEVSQQDKNSLQGQGIHFTISLNRPFH